MKKLLNTLYVNSPDSYLTLDGGTILIRIDGEIKSKVPLLNFESIVTHGDTGMSPALLGECMKRGISVCFMTRSGRFRGRVVGPVRGNVLLRKEQYRISDDVSRCLPFARSIVAGKIHNTKWLIERYLRDHALRLAETKAKQVSLHLTGLLHKIRIADSLDTLRGYEGEGAKQYFGILNDLILQQNDFFCFSGRSRRPPEDPVNALFSYFYSILSNDCMSALETVGLDPYVGFFHRDRPGRASLALDLVEDLRAVMVDRFVLRIINRREIDHRGFIIREDGAIEMDEDLRKKVISLWQKSKMTLVQHPFIDKKIEWGLVPYTQALLLAKTIRGELDVFPAFLYRI